MRSAAGGGARRTQLLSAIAADLLVGEPPSALHPTVWMGRALGAARDRHRARPRTPAASLLAGALTIGAGMAVVGVAASIAERAIGRLPSHLRDSLTGALLKPALSLRALLSAGRQVEEALRADDLVEARRLLAWHLVSRDTTRLSAAEVAGAAIESLAENFSDSFVAPLLAHAIAGLPGAYVYRFVNTADAMLGYRTPELEFFGKAAARADDLLNLVPARLSALLIALAAPTSGGRIERSIRVALGDARRTPSPNAGWPMAAMAGALGVRLDKRRSAHDSRRLYVLHVEGRAPTVGDLSRARELLPAAAFLATGLMMSLDSPSPSITRRRSMR